MNTATSSNSNALLTLYQQQAFGVARASDTLETHDALISFTAHIDACIRGAPRATREALQSVRAEVESAASAAECAFDATPPAARAAALRDDAGAFARAGLPGAQTARALPRFAVPRAARSIDSLLNDVFGDASSDPPSISKQLLDTSSQQQQQQQQQQHHHHHHQNNSNVNTNQQRNKIIDQNNNFQNDKNNFNNNNNFTNNYNNNNNLNNNNLNNNNLNNNHVNSNSTLSRRRAKREPFYGNMPATSSSNVGLAPTSSSSTGGSKRRFEAPRPRSSVVSSSSTSSNVVKTNDNSANNSNDDQASPPLEEAPKSAFTSAGVAYRRAQGKKEPEKKPSIAGAGKRKFQTPFRTDDGDKAEKDSKERKREEHPLLEQLLEDERLANVEPRMVEMILNEILTSNTPVHWDQIAGLQFAKQAVQEIVIWPMLRPELFTGLRQPPRGLLLFGPPGTGKTLIGKAIATQAKSTFFNISASSLTSKWIGEGEKMVRLWRLPAHRRRSALFSVARALQPAVIFIDEIDSLLTARGDNEQEASRRIKTEFLLQMDGAAQLDGERLLVIGATNRPHELDEAVRRRMVKRLYIPLPGAAARAELVRLLLAKPGAAHSLAPPDVARVAAETRGFSGADLTALASEAAMVPVRELTQRVGFQFDGACEVRPMCADDFLEALRTTRASVAPKEIKHYRLWNADFGSWQDVGEDETIVDNGEEAEKK